MFNTNSAILSRIRHLFIWIILGGVIISAQDNGGNFFQLDFSYLKTRLQNDGLSSDIIERHFHHPHFQILPQLLHLNINQPSGKAGYDRYSSEQSIKETAEFLDRNADVFASTLEGSKIDPEVVAAILQVESNLGRKKGNQYLFNVYVTLTLMDNEQRDLVSPDFYQKALAGIDSTIMDSVKGSIIKKSREKAEWAYQELLILMRQASAGNLDPLEVKCSWAGAFGIPQFVPSSYQAYGRDGDQDSKIDLYNLPDAIASIAYYLKMHGYNPDNQVKKRKALWHYNHSQEYVDCILTITERLHTWRIKEAKN
jgi:membrane-bound lytic murein transglycosylase B